jgi:hypothetical protein
MDRPRSDQESSGYLSRFRGKFLLNRRCSADKGATMTDGEKAGRNSDKIQKIKFEDLLSKFPPGELYAIRNLGISRSPSSAPILNKPRLKLYCPDDFCSGLRFFDAHQTQKVALTEKWSSVFLHYSCSNCRSRSKIFAVMARWNAVADEGEAVKIGEWPPFGPQIPARLTTIAGQSKALFLMGCRAEMQGLGIGALVYYRKVLENQKNHIIDEIIRVARRTHPSEPQIERLKAGRGEKEFKKAAEIISDAIPQVLLINDYNPLALLEQALSKGSSMEKDHDALRLAAAIRKILTELSELMARALEDQTDLEEAVSTILQQD